MFPALAGAGTVLLTGALTRQLGGGRYAQGLAALVALLAPSSLYAKELARLIELGDFHGHYGSPARLPPDYQIAR
jgi:hypothetical protein